MHNKLCEIINLSFDNKWSHIPSALSMFDYVSTIFENKFIDPHNGDFIVLGKPHGGQAYYIPWKKAGLIDTYSNLTTVVKEENHWFVNYSSDILGDALGVSIGISLVNKDKNIWVNIGDAVLQMGNTLEAIQYIGHHNLNNIILTIDYNNAQRCGVTNEILNIEPVFKFLKNYGWDLNIIDGHDKKLIKKIWNECNFDKPTCFVFKTLKGKGYPKILNNIAEWHYKTLNETDIRQLLE